MNKIILTIITALTVMLCPAQEHLRFLDVPIEGSLKSYVEKLVKEKNYREVKMTKDDEFKGHETRKLLGEFEKFKDIRIYVHRFNELNHVSSVTVNCDTTEYNFNVARDLMNQYDSIYGKHKCQDVYSLFTIYRWELEQGYIQMSFSSTILNITFIDYTERDAKNLKSFDDLEPTPSLEEYITQSREKETIREICGIPFGSSYEKTKEMLENKYGYPDYSPDKTTIIYKHKTYAGIAFDNIHFLFQSDGNRSYLNGCIFVLEAKSLSDAKKKQEMLHNKLSDKYFMIDDIDSNGNKYYLGGYPPTPGDGVGFSIDILKYDSELAKLSNPYAARLYYGRYNYVKEEF